MRNADLLIQKLLGMGRLRVDFETGHVYAPKSNTPTKPLGAKTRKGYLRTCINLNGERAYIMLHRVVWIAANGIPPTGTQIDHGKDGKTDNRLSNIEAVTGAENIRRATKDGLLCKGGWRDGPRDNKTGRFLGKHAAGRLLDGQEWNQFPEVTP